MARKSLPDFLNVPWRIRDALVVYLGAWLALQVVVVLVLRLLAPIMPWAAVFIQRLIDGQIDATFILALIDAVGALGLILFYLRRRHATWSQLGWRGFDTLKAAGYLLAVFVAFVILTNLALWLVTVFDPSFNVNEPQQNDFIDGASHHASLALIALVIIPPIIEETVFRGFIFPALAKRWGLWLGAVGSSILFGLAHLQANVSIYTFVLGLLLCFMYVRLRSIFPGILLHMINNYLAFIALTTAR